MYKRRPEPVPARTFTPTACFGTGNQLVFVGTLAAFTASNSNIDPAPPAQFFKHAGTAGEQRASPLLDAAGSPPRSCQRRSRFSTAHPAAAQPLPPQHRHLAQLPAQPTQISVSAVPARDAGGLRCRARTCASATGVRREELGRPGRSGGQTGRAPIRSGSGSAADLPATDGPRGPAAPEPTCDWWKRCWDGRRSGSSLARPGERSSASPTSTGGRRDFRSLRMLAASCYAETVDSESAGHALQLLSQMTRREGQSDPADAGQRGERNRGAHRAEPPVALVVDLEPYIRGAPVRRLASGRSAARCPTTVRSFGSHTSFGGRLLVDIVGAEP